MNSAYQVQSHICVELDTWQCECVFKYQVYKGEIPHIINHPRKGVQQHKVISSILLRELDCILQLVVYMVNTSFQSQREKLGEQEQSTYSSTINHQIIYFQITIIYSHCIEYFMWDLNYKLPNFLSQIHIYFLEDIYYTHHLNTITGHTCNTYTYGRFILQL